MSYTTAAATPMKHLADRIADQHARLLSPPLPVDFTYDRNGLRLGIAALQDELRELYDEWTENKKSLHVPGVAGRISHELLDIAAVAMLIYRNVPRCTAGTPCHQQDCPACYPENFMGEPS